MKNLRLFLLSFLLLLASCEKEIFLDYRSIEKIVVIEGFISNETAKVMLTLTRNMEDSVKTAAIEGAAITLSGSDGFSEAFEYKDGYYYSPSGITGQAGITYTLSVVLDGQEYTSYSTMQRQAEIKSAAFDWVDIMGMKVLVYQVEITDIAGEENYYCYSMRRNGENYRWDVFSDRGYADDVIALDIFCMTDSDSEQTKEEKKHTLFDGDIITLEVKTIDRRTYDYLYSLGLSERSSANPINNFSGGCLGYFSAQSVVREETVFRNER